MEVVDMVDQVLQGVKEQMALEEGKQSAFQVHGIFFLSNPSLASAAFL